MELNTAGQKEHALSLEILWLPALMNIKCQANVWLKLDHSQVLRHALTCITTWYLFLKENSNMWYCMLEQMVLPIMKEQKLLTNCWSWNHLLQNCWSWNHLLQTEHIVISHPITRTDSKHLAMKIGDIQSHLTNRHDWKWKPKQ